MPAGRRPSNGPIRHSNPSVHFIEYPNIPYDGPIPVDADPEWPLETIEWWSFVCRMPHCISWGETDWRYAKDTAHLHALWTKNRGVNNLPELRQREAKMGTTMDARIALRIRWVDPDSEEAATATVTPIRKIGS